MTEIDTEFQLKIGRKSNQPHETRTHSADQFLTLFIWLFRLRAFNNVFGFILCAMAAVAGVRMEGICLDGRLMELVYIYPSNVDFYFIFVSLILRMCVCVSLCVLFPRFLGLWLLLLENFYFSTLAIINHR